MGAIMENNWQMSYHIKRVDQVKISEKIVYNQKQEKECKIIKNKNIGNKTGKVRKKLSQ